MKKVKTDYGADMFKVKRAKSDLFSTVIELCPEYFGFNGTIRDEDTRELVLDGVVMTKDETKRLIRALKHSLEP